MRKFKTAAVAGIMAAAMAATTLAGCGEVDGTKAAIVVNDEEVNLGTAAFFLRYQQAETAQLMEAYGFATVGSIWDQQYSAATSSEDAMTYGDNMKATTKEALVESVVLSQHADEYQVTVPDELAASMTEKAAQTYTDNKEAMDKNGIAEADIENVLKLATIQRLMFYPMTEDVDTNVSDEEAAQTRVTYARISVDDDTTQEERDQYKAELQSMLVQITSSGDEANADMTTIASTLDNQNIQSAGYSYGADDTVLPQEVRDAVATLQDGQIFGGVIETANYLYIVRLDAAFDREATDTKKSSIVSERQQEAYQALLDSWVAEAAVEEKQPWKDLKVTDADGYSEVTATSDSAEEAVSSAS